MGGGKKKVLLKNINQLLWFQFLEGFRQAELLSPAANSG